MKIAILTVSTPNRKTLYELTNKTKEKFAAENNVDFVFSDTFKEEIGWNRHPYWLKVLFVKKYISDYDAVLLIDDDAGFVKFKFDFQSFIEHLDKPFYVTEDEGGINSGVILFKNCPESKQFIDFWTSAAYDPKFQFRNFDQEFVIAFFKQFPNIGGILDGKIFNAHHPSFEQKDAKNAFDEQQTLIVHIAGGPWRKDELYKSGEIYKIFGIQQNS